MSLDAKITGTYILMEILILSHVKYFDTHRLKIHHHYKEKRIRSTHMDA